MKALILNEKPKIINEEGKYIVDRVKKYCTSCKADKLMIANYCLGCGKRNK